MPPMAWRCLRRRATSCAGSTRAHRHRANCALHRQRCPFSLHVGGRRDHRAPPTTTCCHRCNRELTAAAVHVLDGKPFGPDCIRKVDPMGDAEIVELATWLAAEDAVTPVTSTATMP